MTIMKKSPRTKRRRSLTDGASSGAARIDDPRMNLLVAGAVDGAPSIPDRMFAMRWPQFPLRSRTLVPDSARAEGCRSEFVRAVDHAVPIQDLAHFGNEVRAELVPVPYRHPQRAKSPRVTPIPVVEAVLSSAR